MYSISQIIKLPAQVERTDQIEFETMTVTLGLGLVLELGLEVGLELGLRLGFC